MIVYQIVSRRNETATLKEKGKLTMGRALSFQHVSKSGNRVTYFFEVGNKQHLEKGEETELDGSYFVDFKNKSFPVLYDPEEPKTNRILLIKSDFEQFNIAIPDTLKNLIERTK